MQFLKTKFYIPDFQKAKVIPRGILTESSIEISEMKLVLVAAPAGFGKTTCLTELLSIWDLTRKTSWLSLDRGDNLPMRFWAYITASLQKQVSDIGTSALELIESSQPQDLESILINLINDIGDYQEELVLVLDDYHTITDQIIHDALDFFIDHLPANLLLVLSGREDPPLNLSRLRVSGQLLEIRQRDLRFTPVETGQYINDISGLDLSKEEIEALAAKTEGWIAGIKLALMSLKDTSDRNQFLKDFTGSNRYILDYLVEEVLKGLPENIHNFMLDISIFDRFSDPLCAYVTGMEDSAATLKYMDRNKLFLVFLDHKRKWFRYHHLFREFLRKHLAVRGRKYAASLHLKAFEWFRKNGTWQEAFHHAVRAQRPELAGEFLAELSHEIFREGGDVTLKPLIEMLPANIIKQYPELNVYKTWIDVLHGKFDSITLLDRMNGRVLSEKSSRLLQGFKANMTGYLAFYRDGDFDEARDQFQKTLDLIPKKHDSIRNATEFMLGFVHRYSGALEEARKQFSTTIKKDRYMSAVQDVSLADLEMECGRLRTAMDIIEGCIASGVDRFGDNLPPIYGPAYVYQGSILREWNHIEKAQRACKLGLKMSDQSNYIEFILIGHMEMARIYAAASNDSEAEKEIDTAIHIARTSSTWALGMMEAFKTRFTLKNRNMDAVEKWAQSFENQMDFDNIPFYRSVEYLTYARVCIEKEDYGVAIGMLDRLIDEDAPEKRNGRLIECLVLKSKAHHMQGKTTSALETLEHSFALTAQQGHTRVYIDEFPKMENLLLEAAQQNLLPNHIKSHIGSADSDKKSKPKISSAVIHDFTETFNDRELSILSEMKSGKSNKDIADKLFLSVNTVRWYASRLFAKLDVKRRGEAVAKAIQLGLID